MMGSLSNGFKSDSNVKKRPFENGCSSSKWKLRNVSAIRDFPPGCGPNAPPISLIPQETASVLIVTDDKVDAVKVNIVGTSAIGVESLPHETVKNSENVGVVEVATDVKGSEGDAMGLSEERLAKKELQNGDVQALSKEEGCDVEFRASAKGKVCDDEVQMPVKSVSGVENKSMLEITDSNTKKGTVPRNKYHRRRVSAVRDFPPFCGWNAPDPTEADRLRINGNKSFGAEDKDKGRSGRSTEGMVVDGEESKGDVRDGTIQKNEPDKPKEKLQKSEPEKIAVIQNSDKDVRDHVGWEMVVYSRDKLVASRPSDDSGGEELNEKVQDEIVPKSESEEIVTEPKNTLHAIIQEGDKHVGSQLRKVKREKPLKKRASDDAGNLGCTPEDRKTVLCLIAAPYCPWRQAKAGLTRSDSSKSRGKEQGLASVTPKKSKKMKSSSASKASYTGTLDLVVRNEVHFVLESEAQTRSDGSKSRSKEQGLASVTPKKSKKIKSSSARKAAYTGTLDLVVRNVVDFIPESEAQREDSPTAQGPHDLDVSLPPFGPKSSSDARTKVRETLRLFQAICRKLLQGVEAKTREGDKSKSRQQGKEVKRIDLAAMKILKEKGKEVNPGIQILGLVPGVEIGDEFQYRVELAIVGIHRLYQAGIDYLKQGKQIVAASIVASGGYDDELDNHGCLIYSGSGGIGKDKQPEDQKLERGNLGLKNSIAVKNPVRVIRGSRETKAAESSDARAKAVMTYVYDGLYTVERYWQDPGPHGKLVFKFELRRIPGQPELTLKEVKKSKKFKTREGRCVDDISGGKELFPICAVNTIDNEKPPPFNYISKMIYPDWYHSVPPKGCDCIGPCSDNRCSCAIKNGGDIPYNHNGAIVESKPLVYECGPSCKCPPSCYNRVTQHSMKIQLEIFKTESRGWGVRSLSSISSGSFICEYIGELLEDTEAEKRTGNDEYLFDIGKNYTDCSLNPDANSSSRLFVEDGGFTIDAANSGNVGRFINHSCSPNLYAQNVLYDQEDKRMPHIMFFAAENIPPLRELTYHYNYVEDTVHDSDGNIKIKRCYCGSAQCTGRMY